jgi:hypothetical protein
MQPFTPAFQELLLCRAHPAAAWLGERVSALAGGAAYEVCLTAFGQATRALGKAALSPSAEERARLAWAGLDWAADSFTLDELGRAALLTAAAEHLREEALAALAEECYRRYNYRARQAVVRALPLLPAPERLLPIAAEARRSPISTIFEALACENPYPARHLPEPDFAALILRALDEGLMLSRVLGLRARLTPALLNAATMKLRDLDTTRPDAVEAG